VTAFEFLAVLLSMVFGLALTELLSGIAKAVHRRRLEAIDEVHLVWSCTVLLVLVLNWWVFFSWESHPTWSFETYLLLVLWTIAQYLLVVTLYTPDSDQNDGRNRMWEDNRIWFLATFIATLVLDIVQTALRGALFSPIWYLPYVLQYVVFSFVGIWSAKRTVQRALAWYVLVSLVAWSFLFRRFLATG